MQFKTEGDIPEQFRPVIEKFSRAIESRWPSADISGASIRIERDKKGRDIIYFEIKDNMGAATSLKCEPSESPEEIGQRAYSKGTAFVSRMSEIACELLRRHKQSPEKYFYGDVRNDGRYPDEVGYVAVNNSYKELLDAGLVERSLVVTIEGRPCSTYIISDTGRTAQAV